MIRTDSRRALIDLLGHGQAHVRMAALHLLSESYTDAPEIYAAIVEGWKRWGVDAAFTELPMLSYLPIPNDKIEDCCWRAGRMAEGQALTSPQSRAAGKLLEQLVMLPAEQLQPFLSRIESIKGRSKIFFRVDLDTLRMRIEFLDYSADQLARILDDSIDHLTRHRDSSEAFRRASAALETIRLRFPDYIDLQSVLEQGSGASPHHEMSFLMTLRTLIRFPQPGMAETIGGLLDSEDEGLISSAVEALVREDSLAAAEVLCELYPASQDPARQWIARGLQRLNLHGLSDRLGHLRQLESEPHLWLMLLIAETRQFDPQSAERLAADLNRLLSPSEMLIDSLRLFLTLHQREGDDRLRDLEEAFTEYLQRIDRGLVNRLGGDRHRTD
ncbi:MAG: hypothetical protein D6753_16850 [Planctomycetota bacterium]|nr:MAG: hypothetical protein D6753_16850 [Planctomycetota bacterium]